jgi:pimeloyl-ACP methyl ester carboxylesterase
MSPRSHVLALVLALAVLGACGPRPKSPDSTAKTPTWSGERRVEVGVRSLSLRCTGNGAPTVVLDADWNQDGTAWQALLGELAPHNRVCTYDRAGLGSSDADPVGPRSVQLLVYDLHELLGKAGERAPFILVGKAMSAYTARLYARQHSQEVAGLVLIDPIHVALEAGLLDLATAKQRDWWRKPPAESEAIDFARSAAIMATPAAPPRLPVYIVGGIAPAPAELVLASKNAKLAAASQRAVAALTERLAAKVSGDPIAAVRALAEQH